MLCHNRRSIALKALAMALVCAVSSSLIGCRELAGSQPLPTGTQDPTYYNSATGALGMRNAAVFAFGIPLPQYIIVTGLLTDELTDLSTITISAGSVLSNGGQITDPLDERILPALTYGGTGSYLSDPVYSQLQGARTALLQAMGQLAAYDTSAKDTVILKPSAGRALRGELYALYAYTEIELADLFCSGVPLSTIDFQHDFTYRSGSATAQVYQDAIAKLDTALALSGDSVRIQNLARIGLGRAYLDLAYLHPAYVAAAADDVSRVPDDYQYQFSEIWGQLNISGLAATVINQVATVADQEGRNGLAYISSGDPRTADTTLFYQTTVSGDSLFFGFPRVYIAGVTQTYAPITIASGIEARLIEAEAALQPGGTGVSAWLSELNQLRSQAVIPGRSALLFDQSDSLKALTDPGTDSARIALTFAERAAWLYMTGHRQGDLRRQLRQYARYWPDQSRVYPSGTYLGSGSGGYGTDVTAPVPANEYINPLFHGCLNRAP